MSEEFGEYMDKLSVLWTQILIILQDLKDRF
jgi:hypothetical protein